MDTEDADKHRLAQMNMDNFRSDFDRLISLSKVVGANGIRPLD